MARSRNNNGRFRQKRADTHLGTLEKMYDGLSPKRSDTHLGSLRKTARLSLSKILKGR